LADKKVFPKLDVVGWYSTGSAVQETDLELQRLARRPAVSFSPLRAHAKAQMNAVMESPVYLLFNPSVVAATKDLPVTLYEAGTSALAHRALLIC